MSVKIWEAYRIPTGRLVEFTDLMHDAMFEGARKIVERLMESVTNGELETAVRSGELLFPKDYDLTDKKRNRRARLEFVLEKCKEMATHSAKNAFDINCGFNFWIDGRYSYVIPIADLVVCIPDFPEWVADFYYQNQVDPPDPSEVSPRKWKARKEKWGELCLGSVGEKSEHNARRFYHSVVEMTPPRHIPSYVDMQFAILDDPSGDPKNQE